MLMIYGGKYINACNVDSVEVEVGYCPSSNKEVFFIYFTISGKEFEFIEDINWQTEEQKLKEIQNIIKLERWRYQKDTNKELLEGVTLLASNIASAEIEKTATLNGLKAVNKKLLVDTKQWEHIARQENFQRKNLEQRLSSINYRAEHADLSSRGYT